MSQFSKVWILVATLALGGVAATGCSVVNKVKQAVHNAEGNKATIDSFTQGLKSNQTSAFEATYMTSGSAPSTVVYAVDPATGGLAFHAADEAFRAT